MTPIIPLERDAFERAAGRQIEGSAPWQRRRRAVRRAGTAICVAVLAVIVPEVRYSPPASAGVSVRVVGNDIHILITDVEADPEAVEQTAQAEGLHVLVTAVPTGPSQIGKVVATAGDQGPGTVEAGPDGRFAGFSVPRGWTGHLDIKVGRRAQRGESYAAYTNAYAPGESLHCSDVWGKTVTEATPTLDGYGHRIRYQVAVGPTTRELDKLNPSIYGSWYVTDAAAVSEDDVVVFVRDNVSDSLNGRPDDGSCTSPG